MALGRHVPRRELGRHVPRRELGRHVPRENITQNTEKYLLFVCYIFPAYFERFFVTYLNCKRIIILKIKEITNFQYLKSIN